MPDKIIAFSEQYKQDCFSAWFLNGRPKDVSKIKRILPEDGNGNKPSTNTLSKWVNEDGWILRADELDAKAIQLSDDDLIQRKASMLRKHYGDAVAIADKARDFILQQGFDGSNSAVKAYFDATAEQRAVNNMGDLFVKISKMTNEDIVKEIVDLVGRGSRNQQIIEIVGVESKDEGDEDKDAKTGEP